MPVVASGPIYSPTRGGDLVGNGTSARSRVADSIVEGILGKKKVRTKLVQNSDKADEGDTDVYHTPVSSIQGDRARRRNPNIYQQTQNFTQCEEDALASQQGRSTPTTSSTYYKSPAMSSRSSPVTAQEQYESALPNHQVGGFLPKRASDSLSVEQWLHGSGLPQFQNTEHYEGGADARIESTLDVLITRMNQLDHKIEDLQVQQNVSARGGYAPKTPLPRVGGSPVDAVEVGKRVLLESLLKVTSGPMTPVLNSADELPVSSGAKYGGGLVDINKACGEEMTAIPGVSLRQATEIVRERNLGGEYSGPRNLRNRLRLDQLNNPTFRRIRDSCRFSMTSPRADDNILVFGVVLVVQAVCLVLYFIKVLLRPNLFGRIKTYLQYQHAPGATKINEECNAKRRQSLTIGSSLGV